MIRITRLDSERKQNIDWKFFIMYIKEYSDSFFKLIVLHAHSLSYDNKSARNHVCKMNHKLFTWFAGVPERSVVIHYTYKSQITRAKHPGCYSTAWARPPQWL